MKSIIEKNAARIIITTLIALVIVGIAIGAGLPFNADNYNPGHSILKTGDPNYYFVEDTFSDGTTKFLALELTGNNDYVGRLDIRPGLNDGVVIRQGGDFGLGDPGLFLRAFGNHARLNFYPGGGAATTPNQLSVYEDKVVIPSGIELCIGGTGSANCKSFWPGAIGGHEIVSRACSSTARSCEATCPVGKVLTGGGCKTSNGPGSDHDALFQNYPLNSMTWHCGAQRVQAEFIAYAICANAS